MGFNASDAVSELAWDFRPYVNANGVTLEPSDDQVHKMNVALRDAVLAVTGQDFDPSDQLAAAAIFTKLTDTQMREMEDANIAAIAIVTGDSPSPAQMRKLPFRLRRLYIKSLMGDLNDPEG